MRTFARQSKTSQQTESPKSTKPGRTHFGQSREVGSILHLQRTIGNQAVQRLLQAKAEALEARSTGHAWPGLVPDFSPTSIFGTSRGQVWQKPTVHTPGDSYEQEADRVADQVMRKPEPQLQRDCPCDGGCPKCQEQHISQENARWQDKGIREHSDGRNTAPPIVHKVLHSTGQPLDSPTKAYFEPRFGCDFSQVRVHTDLEAAATAEALNAKAFPAGNDIVFEEGQYSPASDNGQRLLAHELVHVQQQITTTPAANPGRVPSVQREQGRPPAQSGVLETGFAAHLRYMRERVRAMNTMSPNLRLVEDRTLARMREILRREPNAQNELPILLHTRAQREALAALEERPPSPEERERPEPPPAEEFNQRLDRYRQVADQLRSYRTRSTRLTRSPWEQRVWLHRENQTVQEVLNLMADRLMTWALEHIDTAHQHAPEDALNRIAGESEMQALFHAAQLLPLDAEAFSTARDVPMWQRVGRIVWGFVPILGDLTDLSEAFSGLDIVEARRLSGVERTIMLVGAILPFVPGSALRGGREAVGEAAVRLAARSPGASIDDMQRVLRAAEAVGDDARRVRDAIRRIRAGERLSSEEVTALGEVARRVDQAASASSGTPARAVRQAVQEGAGRGVSGGGQPLRVLVVGAERLEEFDYARRVAQNGAEVTVANPSMTAEARRFSDEGYNFVQQPIQQLPEGNTYNIIREDFPVPTGRLLQAADHFLDARLSRLASGGNYVLVTESVEFANAIRAAAELRRAHVFQRFARPARRELNPETNEIRIVPGHETTPMSEHAREFARIVLVISQ